MTMHKWSLLLVMGCAIAMPSPALAATPIPPALLVVHPQDLPGFFGAKSTLSSAMSALLYAQQSGDTPQEAEVEVTHLQSEGFYEGVSEILAKAQNEAVSNALVFDSAQSAKHELIANLSEDLKSHAKDGLKRFHVPAIPGSVGLDQLQNGKPGAAGNVLFVTGRCFLLVGDVVRDALSRRQGIKAPIAGAIVLYRRIKHLCA
jgi:hypothetical protein